MSDQKQEVYVCHVTYFGDNAKPWDRRSKSFLCQKQAHEWVVLCRDRYMVDFFGKAITDGRSFSGRVLRAPMPKTAQQWVDLYNAHRAAKLIWSTPPQQAEHESRWEDHLYEEYDDDIRQMLQEEEDRFYDTYDDDEECE